MRIRQKGLGFVVISSGLAMDVRGRKHTMVSNGEIIQAGKVGRLGRSIPTY